MKTLLPSQSTSASPINRRRTFRPALNPLVAARGFFARRQFPSRPAAWIPATKHVSWKTQLALLAVTLASLIQPAAAAPMDNWTSVPVAGNAIKTPNDLIFANGKYFTVGVDGKVGFSTDGKSWTVVQTPTTKTLTSITQGNGLYVAVGYGMTILSSSNGQDWTIRETNAAKPGESFTQVIFANGKFLAISAQPGAAVVRLSSDGITWTPGTMNGTKFYPHGVAWGNGVYAAVGAVDGNYTVQTSSDGLTWTRRSTSFTTRLESIAWFKNLFVAAGTAATPVLATSPDGVTWTKVANVSFPSADTEIWGIKVLNGRVFVFGDHGLLLSSANGVDWTKHTTGTNDTISNVDYNGSALYMTRRSDDPAGGGAFVSAPWAPEGTTNPVPPVPPDPTPGDNSQTRIVNLSSRAWVGTGDSQFIAGFVIQGSSPKKVLIRAIGPTLAPMGVPGVLADPQLRVVASNGTDVGTNNDWGSGGDANAIAAASAAVGAFALPNGSKDAAALMTLSPGAYTIVMSGVNGGTGVALAEVYDVDAPGACKLVNIASRAFVGTGDNVTIAGFVVSGSAPRQLLIRGIGPTLAGMGVAGAIADPRIALYNSSQAKLMENDDWGVSGAAEIQAAAAKVGAFALPNGSKDATLLVTLNPGVYSVIMRGATDVMTGVGMIEVYQVP